MKNLFKSIIVLGLLVGFFSCSDDSEGIEKGPTVKPGIYTSDITVSAEQRDKSEIVTRGVSESGMFTSDYDFPEIYIHSADTKTEENGHRVLKIPVKTITKERADEAGKITSFRLEVEILEGENGYIMRNEAGDEIELLNNEKVYFSSLDKPYWEATTMSVSTPITKSDVFVEDTKKNIELLRSETYTKENLEQLIKGESALTLVRCTTGFRIYMTFTDVVKDGDGEIKPITTPEDWLAKVGYPYESFLIKLYLGPNFAHKYDILHDGAIEGDKGGYYVTNQAKYKKFEYTSYTVQDALDKETEYKGFGYKTDPGNILLSPLDKKVGNGHLCIYTFIRFASDPTNIDFATDEGSKYFEIDVDKITGESGLNQIHFIIVGISYKDLIKAFKLDSQSIKTRSPWSGPEKIELTPAKVIVR